MYILDEQIGLFNEYFQNNDIWKANMLIKNIFNKNIDNREIFQIFFEFNVKITSWNVDTPTRKMFLNQASTAVVFFAENVQLTKELIEYIQNCENEIEALKEEINRVEQIQSNRQFEEAKKIQTELLSKLTEFKFEIVKCKSQTEFQEILQKVKETEEQIDESLLDDKELNLYQELTKEYPEVINNKLEHFDRVKIIDYNKNAVVDFHHAFKEFKLNEEKYKTNMAELRRLLGRDLFGYDSSQLANETLIYYNHVYSYIFGKLDEDGKFNLTDFAIEMEENKK